MGSPVNNFSTDGDIEGKIAVPEPIAPTIGDPFYEWAVEVGIDTSAMERGIEHYGSVPVRGVKAARDITSGETFLRLLLPQTFTLASIHSDPILAHVLGKDSDYWKFIAPLIINNQKLDFSFNDEVSGCESQSDEQVILQVHKHFIFSSLLSSLLLTK